MLSVHVFETKMKNSDNSKYVDEIDEAVEINQSLRLLFIVFTGSLVTKIAKFAKVHPVFGKFILAIAQVIVSNSITHFLMLYMLFYLMMILCYHVMFGDVVIDFADFLRTAMTLVRLGITGEHEEGDNDARNFPVHGFFMARNTFHEFYLFVYVAVNLVCNESLYCYHNGRMVEICRC